MKINTSEVLHTILLGPYKYPNLLYTVIYIAMYATFLHYICISDNHLLELALHRQCKNHWAELPVRNSNASSFSQWHYYYYYEFYPQWGKGHTEGKACRCVPLSIITTKHMIIELLGV